MITYHFVEFEGLETFYRQAGPSGAPTIVLLHGFPSSSHMFRDLIPKLEDRFHLVAPDYIGFGYSANPSADEFCYTFESLTDRVETLLFNQLALTKFTIYVQDYGAPIGFRLASRHPYAIQAIIVQNGNAYAEGLSPAWEPLRALWAKRDADTERAASAFLTAETTKFQYIHGVRDPARISPDAYAIDQHFLDRPGNAAIQMALFHDYASNLAMYTEWHSYFREHQPPMLVVWGQNDPFFTVEGAKAFRHDLPDAELHLLDTGHFALEDHSAEIARLIGRFLQDAETNRSRP
ncbi:MAG TPA: alpha/beta hydrolase [Pyrinomonadaceae bacterium]|nr:alpha/beta hydrolase [Pyrinomonadaceae bacterium]